MRNMNIVETREQIERTEYETAWINYKGQCVLFTQKIILKQKFNKRYENDAINQCLHEFKLCTIILFYKRYQASLDSYRPTQTDHYSLSLVKLALSKSELNSHMLRFS